MEDAVRRAGGREFQIVEAAMANGAAGFLGFEERNDKQMLVGGRKRLCGRVACEKVEKIGRLKIMESFESD